MSDDDLIVPPATAVATEIHERFNTLMAKGGRIDRILNGHPEHKIEPLPDVEIERIKVSIDVQMVEYEAAISAAVEWYAGWKAKQPKGFRANRRKKASDSSHVKHDDEVSV